LGTIALAVLLFRMLGLEKTDEATGRRTPTAARSRVHLFPCSHVPAPLG
jgi:hypothetical protein